MALAHRTCNALLPDQMAARSWFERTRWPAGPVCPACGCVNHACRLKTTRRWNHAFGRRTFSATAGTQRLRMLPPPLTQAQCRHLSRVVADGVSTGAA